MSSPSRAPSVRRFAAHEWRKYRSLRLRALADSPDAFASTLAQEEGRPDADWEARLVSGAASALDLPLVAELGGETVGLAWARVDAAEPEVAHVYQMWVDAGARRAGIGRALLEAAIAWAPTAGARFLRLAVTRGNTPAVRLYARLGFVPRGDPEPLRPGSALEVQPLQLALRARSRARLVAGAIAYALLVFLGAASVGFVVLPTLGYASGLFDIESEARGTFSLLTLKAVPWLVGLSAAAALSYEWIVSLSLGRRIAVYVATTLLVWLTGAAVAMVILG